MELRVKLCLKLSQKKLQNNESIELQRYGSLNDDIFKEIIQYTYCVNLILAATCLFLFFFHFLQFSTFKKSERFLWHVENFL